MIHIENLIKIFHSKKTDTIALNSINLHLKKGSFTLIKGASGCGKSTLLFTIGGVLNPSSGDVIVDANNIYKLSDRDMLNYRSEKIGFVYQSYHLIPYLNTKENILLGCKLTKQVICSDELDGLIREFNLQDRLQHKPSELSEGEKQRVALMRALITNPKILIADEPTGNLDPENRHVIMAHFTKFQKQGGTVIMASHGTEADSIADTIIEMKTGEIINIQNKR